VLRIWETTLTSYAFILDDTSFRASETRTRLDSLAPFLDSAVHVPGTNVRFGADALLNLIPGIGTLASKGMSAYLIWEAQRLGVPKSTLLRMASNVGVDFVISAVPLVGWVGDVFFRSTLRTMAMLRRPLDQVHPMTTRPRANAALVADRAWLQAFYLDQAAIVQKAQR